MPHICFITLAGLIGLVVIFIWLFLAFRGCSTYRKENRLAAISVYLLLFLLVLTLYQLHSMQ